MVAAARGLVTRGAILVYLVVPRARYTTFDAHYFPELSTPVSRMNEPKNYRDSDEDPTDRTVLCAEVPCWAGDDVWNASFRGRTVDGTWRDVAAVDPDVICLVPPGRRPGDPRPAVDTAAAPGWSELKAVRAGRVYLFDGDIGFARPGPRLYRAVELLAATLYPDRLGDVVATIEPWERQTLAP